ncbi:hypothetical protein [Porphyromonas macacae]|uniref:hypothetical protein n=1 Tax=Porphyromonas macacae TaxID=28115 RepID=UPI0011C04969|nr:hypothetical protein [Porphyromonas macacae]
MIRNFLLSLPLYALLAVGCKQDNAFDRSRCESVWSVISRISNNTRIRTSRMAIAVLSESRLSSFSETRRLVWTGRM